MLLSSSNPSSKQIPKKHSRIFFLSKSEIQQQSHFNMSNTDDKLTTMTKWHDKNKKNKQINDNKTKNPNEQ